MTSVAVFPVESRIRRVNVYARGAVVTRQIALPEQLPKEAVCLKIAQVTPLAEFGSFQAEMVGTRDVLSVKPRLQLQTGRQDRAEAQARVLKLTRQLRTLESERSQLKQHRRTLLETSFQLRAKSFGGDVMTRVERLLEINDLMESICRSQDSTILRLEEEKTALKRALETAQLALSQSKLTVEGEGSGVPHLDVEIHLMPGEGTVDTLSFSYVVSAARWWPAYAMRLGQNGDSTRCFLEAFVVQATMEDWSNAVLNLCTADQIRDVRLPTLHPLRIGRARPLQHRGYRPPPTTLDDMFVGFDRAMGETRKPLTMPARHAEQGPSSDTRAFGSPGPEDLMLNYSLPEPAKQGGSPVPSLTSMPPAASVMPVASKSMLRSRAASRSTTETGSIVAQSDIMGRGAGGVPTYEDPKEEVLWLSEAWANFDDLELSDPTSALAGNRRGRISPRPRTEEGSLSQLRLKQLSTLQAPTSVSDPKHHRGLFNHSFETPGHANVPSNGLPHRIKIAEAEARTTTTFRTSPGVTKEVFREVTVTNPFDAPLLPGPMDIFIDDALVTTSSISAVDRGGDVTFGLGQEERIRVDRDVRVEEQTKGLLRGTTSLIHTTTTTLSSSLGYPVKVKIVDKIPITTDKNIEINVISSSEKYIDYEQIDLNKPVKGGLAWTLDLPAGGDIKVKFSYEIKHSTNFEIVGGINRD